MPTYTQRIQFEREFVIEAKDAEEANDKLAEAISRVEWDADVRECSGFYRFEDDPVSCPACKGTGIIYVNEEDEDGPTCERCGGAGEIPFVAENK